MEGGVSEFQLQSPDGTHFDKVFVLLCLLVGCKLFVVSLLVGFGSLDIFSLQFLVDLAPFHSQFLADVSETDVRVLLANALTTVVQEVNIALKKNPLT